MMYMEASPGFQDSPRTIIDANAARVHLDADVTRER
jgi:hypothetical protein